jgi:proline dehydrogenase
VNVINQLIVGFVKILPKQVVYIFAKKYNAGIKLEDAVQVVKELNAKGLVATMDVLGEAINTKKEAEEAKRCLHVLDTINRHN